MFPYNSDQGGGNHRERGEGEGEEGESLRVYMRNVGTTALDILSSNQVARKSPD